jgi:hypothetical protein
LPVAVLRRSGWLQQSTAALLACLVALSGIAGIVHRTATVHVVCPEHGELVHADGDAHGAITAMGTADPRPVPWREGIGPVGGPARGEAGDDHEHCGLSSTELKRLSRPLSCQAHSLVGATELVRPFVAAILPARSPLYLTAPKNSPPRPA